MIFFDWNDCFRSAFPVDLLLPWATGVSLFVKKQVIGSLTAFSLVFFSQGSEFSHID
jgi:hypothetical protein